MNPGKQKSASVTFDPSLHYVPLKPDLSVLRQSEKEAYEFILEHIEEEDMLELTKLKFLRAVETLSSAVQAQAEGNMNNYCSKTILAKKIETLILQESTEFLTSNVRQQAMLCIVALRSFPAVTPRDPLALWTLQALDDMLQSLVMDDMNPDMLILQSFLEIILPWLLLSDKVYEQTRAFGTISRLLRFICNFPKLLHMTEFSMSGKLMGILGLFCVDLNHDISMGASEALHYLFTILVLQRTPKDTAARGLEEIPAWDAGIVETAVVFFLQFFKKYLTPNERADMIIVGLEAMTNVSRHDVHAASTMLKTILQHTIPEIGKVPEIIQYIYHHMNGITEVTAQMTIKKILYVLAQSYTEEVILTLFKMEDQSQKGIHKPWEILASFPKGYEMIMGYLLQRLTPYQQSKDHRPRHRSSISPLIATRAIHELLQESSRRIEVQTFFSSLFMALLFQVSSLVMEGGAEMIQDSHNIAEWMDPISSTVEALKTLMINSGYKDHVTSIQNTEGWSLLVNPKTHYDGVALLAKSLVIHDCWHNRPIFRILIKTLKDLDCKNHLTAFVFLTELLQCPDVADLVDNITTHILANWFKTEDPATVKLLLQLTEIYAKNEYMVKWGIGPACAQHWRERSSGDGNSQVRHLRVLQPYVMNLCYSLNSSIVVQTLLVLKELVIHLTWKFSSSFLLQLTFTLVPFFDEESENLRVIAFQIYGRLLAKIKRRVLVFPLKHQVLNLIITTVLHLKDVNADVALVQARTTATVFPFLMPSLSLPGPTPTLLMLSLLVPQICKSALCQIATLLGWSKLKEVFTEKDMWTILTALLQQEKNKALWFLRQSVVLFKSPQAPIRQAAVWFAGQIIQTLDSEEMDDIEEVYVALRDLQKDPDPMVSCLTTQTFYILEVKRKMLQTNRPTSCFCRRKARRSYF
uniref:Maestro heat like repeat family member 7 n=1 Tax=Otolemur garnettii TaxID=30611 RepID=H0XRZ8_OTOGA